MNDFVLFKENVFFDIANSLYFDGYKGSNWFSLNGEFRGDYISPQVLTLPKGTYSISLNRALKKTSDGNEDRIYLSDSQGRTFVRISTTPREFSLEKTENIHLYFMFFTGSEEHYTKGEFFEKQEDYGKDYFININVISGGLYEREKKYAVLKGDLNEDGMVTLQDLAKLRAYTLGAEYLNETDLFRYDINGDGIIDAADLTPLRKYLIGQEKLYDIEFRDEVEH